MAEMIPSQARSALVMALMQNAQRNQGRPSYSLAGSLDIASQPIVAAMLAKREQQAQDEQSRTQQARMQGLAGALSRAGQGGPQGEAARRAAMIIAGGMPDDPLAKALLGAQAESIFAPQKQDDLFGVVNPSDFTPESLQTFSQSKKYGDLVPRENIYGRYTPSQYTAESWAKFRNSQDAADLVLRPEFRFVQTPSGAPVAGNTLTGQVSPTSVTPEAAIDEAATRKEAEAEAAATGEARGTAVANLPVVLSTSRYALETVDKLLNHPGRSAATGSSRNLGAGLQRFGPWSSAVKDFEVLREQARGQIFLDAYQALKGGGQITEVEGLKAEQAKARMDAAQTDQEYVAALNEFKQAIQRGIQLAQTRAGQQPSPQPQPQTSDIGSLLDKYAPR